MSDISAAHSFEKYLDASDRLYCTPQIVMPSVKVSTISPSLFGNMETVTTVAGINLSAQTLRILMLFSAPVGQCQRTPCTLPALAVLLKQDPSQDEETVARSFFLYQTLDKPRIQLVYQQ